MSLCVILIFQENFPRYLSSQQVVSELMLVWGKCGKIINVHFAVGMGTGCVYL